jgi:Mrp family chromosome partitioning ATPase
LRAEEAKNRYEQAQRDLKANVDGPASARTDLLNILRAQRSQLNDQIAQKRAVLGERHPDLVISVNQLSELNRQIEIERKRTIDSAKSDYETVLDQQKSLESQLKSLEGDMLVDGQAAVKLQELQRDAEANRNIYEQFLSRFKTTNEQRLLPTSQAKVVSSATAPTRPTRPSLALIAVALAIGALLSSAAVVTLLEAVRGSANEDSEETDPDPEPAEVEAPLNPADWSGNSDLAASGVEKSVWRATMLHEGAAELSGHLRELLDTIVVMPGQRGKVVLVTSGETGVGKSVVARSLNSLAVERGMLSVLIEILPEQFLLRARQGRVDEGMADRARPLRTDARSVNLLLETSQTVAVAAFPEDVRTEFDLIVIDAPALTEQSDVAALLAHADFTILVARDGATNPGAIDRARAALSGFGNSLIGIVINKTDDKVDSRMATAR